MPPSPIELGAYRKIVILTGAGVSKASGLPTYRGEGGLWSRPEVAQFNDARALDRDPAGLWAFFGELRSKVRVAPPNPAHEALARVEQRLDASQRMTVITQNVDELHQRAGSVNVVELHGSLFRTRCTNVRCRSVPFHDEHSYESPPLCPQCHSPLRPAVTLFSEAIDVDAEWQSKLALRDCQLFLAIGTSGSVSPASNFVRSAAYEGALTVFINTEPMNPINDAFARTILGRAEDVLPSLFV